VHVLGAWVEQQPHGHKLFEGISAANALETLRCVLKRLHIANAEDYRTHDLRRGHALDLQLSGALAWGFFSLCACLRNRRSTAVENLGSRGMAIARIPELSGHEQVRNRFGCASTS
jgi:hypothetical protein